MAQRFSAHLWYDAILRRTVFPSSLQFMGLAMAAVALVRMKGHPARRVIAASLALFLLPFIVFTNLHIVHDYYQMANAVFLSIAVGLSFFYLLKTDYVFPLGLGHAALVAAFLASNYYEFLKSPYFSLRMWETQAQRQTMQMCDFIKHNTPADRPVIWFGSAWTSEYAFYSERKSLTDPDWPQPRNTALVENWEKHLNKRPSAIVVCPWKQEVVRPAIARKFGEVLPIRMNGWEIYLLGGG